MNILEGHMAIRFITAIVHGEWGSLDPTDTELAKAWVTSTRKELEDRGFHELWVTVLKPYPQDVKSASDVVSGEVTCCLEVQISGEQP